MLGWFLDRFKSAGAKSLLDIGCGIGRHARDFESFHYLGLDLVRDYLIKAAAGSNLPYVIGDASRPTDMFVPKSFDAVLWYDSIEHLDKDVGINAIADSMTIARKRVGVFTPLGFLEQTENVWGGDAGDAQVHKSGWTDYELRHLGFEEIEIVTTSRRGIGSVRLMLAMAKVG